MGRAAKTTYDYIVIGSGSAGSVIAARLAEDPNLSVLLLEAGSSDDHIYIRMPASLGFPLTDDRFNWFYSSEPEPRRSNHSRISWPRLGRIVLDQRHELGSRQPLESFSKQGSLRIVRPTKAQAQS
ncbi:NAD(P)-binding protein [Mesorhizobium album]|uniref:NAD(P)-binding protein n=1 Tax=Mesorhizobium album TaxID=3072314 RepID=UPI003D3103F0